MIGCGSVTRDQRSRVESKLRVESRSGRLLLLRPPFDHVRREAAEASQDAANGVDRSASISNQVDPHGRDARSSSCADLRLGCRSKSQCEAVTRVETRRRARVVLASFRENHVISRKKVHVGLGCMQHAPSLSGVVLVELEDGVLRILLVTRRSACVTGERVEDCTGDREVGDDGARDEASFASRRSPGGIRRSEIFGRPDTLDSAQVRPSRRCSLPPSTCCASQSS